MQGGPEFTLTAALVRQLMTIWTGASPRGRGKRTTPLSEKSLKLTVEISAAQNKFWKKSLEFFYFFDRENPGFLRKRPPFKIQASHMMKCNTKGSLEDTYKKTQKNQVPDWDSNTDLWIAGPIVS
jgi:sulfite reductase alpha subunit-like flavoprotein